MNKNLDVKSIWPSLKKTGQTGLRHITFAVVLIILFVYLFTVWRISQLAIAEPSPEDESAILAGSRIPKIDKKAIEQIGALEASNTEIKSLFDQARNNPFQE